MEGYTILEETESSTAKGDTGMAIKNWETVKLQYCHHACADVCLEAEVVYPAEWMPDQPPRILARRCSHGMHCNLDGRPSCVWAGTNPAYDPFAAKME